ncbi:hypothetical protein [Trueperella pyogenes]|uniref:hypothetical protein n=1 Tax=Trueperella pyogenes TaxID=1661 RepID=UPI00345CE767
MGKVVAVWEEELPYTPHQIWQVVTDLAKWQWRSDLSDCKVLDERRFIEFPKKENRYVSAQPTSKNLTYGNFRLIHQP